jgi:hypothetical protein
MHCGYRGVGVMPSEVGKGWIQIGSDVDLVHPEPVPEGAQTYRLLSTIWCLCSAPAATWVPPRAALAKSLAAGVRRTPDSPRIGSLPFSLVRAGMAIERARVAPPDSMRLVGKVSWLWCDRDQCWSLTSHDLALNRRLDGP